MPDAPKPTTDMSAFEQLLIGAAVIGVVAGFVLWMLLTHEEDATRVFKMGIGKVTKWLE
jgi:hypothetical protein